MTISILTSTFVIDGEMENIQISDLKTYLTSVKEQSHNINDKSIHIILGNESCDLDSMISAISLAYFYYKTIYISGGTIPIPILNIIRDEFLSHVENVFVLQKFSITDEDLLFISDINITTLAEGGSLKVTLVDHHVLGLTQTTIKPLVTEIFDHRPEDITVNWQNTVKKTIKLVGSCSTLIADEIIKHSVQLPDDSVYKLLYDAIIFDTIGLSVEADKARPLDHQICEVLESRLHFNKSNREFYFQKLWQAHSDISHLTTKQLLYKDLKKINTNLFIPGLPMLVKDFLQRVDVKETLQHFCSENQLKILLLMGLETKGGVKRDLALYKYSNDILFEEIKMKLEKEKFLGLINNKINTDVENIIYYQQNNVKASRKQIIPIFK